MENAPMGGCKPEVEGWFRPRARFCLEEDGGLDRMGCPVPDHAALCGAGSRAAGQRRGRPTWTINQHCITNTNTNTTHK